MTSHLEDVKRVLFATPIRICHGANCCDARSSVKPSRTIQVPLGDVLDSGQYRPMKRTQSHHVPLLDFFSMTIPLPPPYALPEALHDRPPGLFLDFDGTLVDLAPAPEAIQVSLALPALLDGLLDRLGGALALVSGRPVTELDAHLGRRYPAAGVHGMERRTHVGGTIHRQGGVALEPVVEGLLALAAADPRLRVERKPGAVALHYRGAPERAVDCRDQVLALTGNHSELHVLQGKMVLEIKPSHIDKGRAVSDFCAGPPFAGRVPVFIGDDVTDEDGFHIVNDLGGMSVKVGEGTTAAAYRLPDVAAVQRWLSRLLDHLNSR